MAQNKFTVSSFILVNLIFAFGLTGHAQTRRHIKVVLDTQQTEYA